jgi:anti-sigma factor RsiW
MSLPPDTMLDLMALADGELQGEARERAEKLVAQNEEARRLVEHMRSPALGSLLEEALSHHAAEADGIAEAVMARLDRKDEAPAAVVRMADARARRGVPGPLLAGTLGVLAVAAAIALYLRSSQEQPDVRSPVASVGGSSVDVQVPPTTLAQAARPAQDVEVDQLESEHDITVFSIPLGGAAAAAIPGNPSSVVIMIEDDPGPQ